MPWRKRSRGLMSPILTCLIIFGLSLLAEGCMGVIPADLREKVRWNIGLRDLKRELQTERGQLVLLGGEILDVRTSVDEDAIEVLQRPLDSWDRPILMGESEGRFVVRVSKQTASNSRYQEGQPLTVAGEVTGEVEARPGKDLPSPVLLSRYLLLWSSTDYILPPRSTSYYDRPYWGRSFLFLRHRRLRNPCG
jgi:starvation-inducible outer membrane lipoprotein